MNADEGREKSGFARPQPIVPFLREKREKEGPRFVMPRRVELGHQPHYFSAYALFGVCTLAVLAVGLSLVGMLSSFSADLDAGASQPELPPIPLVDTPRITFAPVVKVIPDVVSISLVRLSPSYRTPPPERRPVPEPGPKLAKVLPPHETTEALPPKPKSVDDKHAATFATAAIIYSAPHNADDEGSPALASTQVRDYQVVSILSDRLALISADVNGHRLVSPYHVGQALPDGSVITSIDEKAGQVVTNEGPLSAGHVTMSAMTGG